jgi:hypothetical protein
MKKMRMFLAVLLAIGLWVGAAHAQVEVSRVNEPGSMLVFPLIDNTTHPANPPGQPGPITYNTIIEIVNRANTDVWLAGFMITHGPGDPYAFEKKDFFIHLTQKEPFWWDTGTAYSRTDADGVLTQIQSFNQRKGFMFVWAVDSDKTALEIDWDFLKGDAIIFGNGNAFRYNAYPHQMLAAAGDRVLNIDGVEYTAAPSQIICEGFAENWVPNLGGTLAVANLDIDFILSEQPEFDINIQVWNQNEVAQSRHLSFNQFEQYDLTEDLQLAIDQIFTPKWEFATTSTNPLWAVYFHFLNNAMWGGMCHQHPDSGVSTAVVLPPVPLAQ